MAKLDGSRLNRPFPASANVANDSPMAALFHMPLEVTKSLDVNGTGGEVVSNVFSYDGPFEIIKLYGQITDATDITTASGVYFDIYDGVTNAVLTLDGLSLSGATVNSIFIKDALKTSALTLLDADQTRFEESPFNRPFVGGAIGIKNGGTHYVRLRVDTDANTDITVLITMRYIHLSEDTSVAAV